ncbi:uncharacterized protein LOC135115087 [Scylla paramamosain]|uniref:uncharacterized protein LOC135115087 n=1 Tax=Scylla paramamosain TaxID=85552 RepID=UPI0030827DB2
MEICAVSEPRFSTLYKTPSNSSIHLSPTTPVQYTPVSHYTCLPLHLSNIHLSPHYTCPIYTCPPLHLSSIHLSPTTPVQYTPVSHYTCPIYTCLPLHLSNIHLSPTTPVQYTPVPTTPVQYTPVPHYTCPAYTCIPTPLQYTPVFHYTCSPTAPFQHTPVPHHTYVPHLSTTPLLLPHLPLHSPPQRAQSFSSHSSHDVPPSRKTGLASDKAIPALIWRATLDLGKAVKLLEHHAYPPNH